MKNFVVASLTIEVPCKTIMYNFAYIQPIYAERFVKDFVRFGEYRNEPQFIVYELCQFDNDQIENTCFVKRTYYDCGFKREELNKCIDRVINLHSKNRQINYKY